MTKKELYNTFKFPTDKIKNYSIASFLASLVLALFIVVTLISAISLSPKGLKGSITFVEFIIKPTFLDKSKELSSEVQSDNELKKYVEIKFQKIGRRNIVSFDIDQNNLALDVINKLERKLKSQQYLLLNKEYYQHIMPSNYIVLDVLIYTSLLSLLIFGIFWFFYFKKYEHNFSKTFSYKKVGVIIFQTILFVAVLQLVFFLIKLTGLKINQDIMGFGDTVNDKLTKFLVWAVLITPLLEEIVFRGIIYRIFCIYKFPVVGMLITSLYFSILHFIFIGKLGTASYIFYFIVYFNMSLLFTWIYKKHNSIWAAYLAHITLNIIGILVFYMQGASSV